MISSLSKLLRMTIDKNKEIISFREEVQIVLDYINIMNMRQKEQVKVEISVHEEAYALMIPRFILQPIIENSIIHGLNQHAGTIVLSTEYRENQLVIMIEDNGQGMDDASLEKLKRKLVQPMGTENSHHTTNKGFSSLGLSNVYERMFITFGGSFRMDIKSLPGEGTKVILTIQKGGNNSDVQSNAS
jgi:two-component system, sensor histidine kinase YesM